MKTQVIKRARRKPQNEKMENRMTDKITFNGPWCATHNRPLALCDHPKPEITCEHGVGVDVLCAVPGARMKVYIAGVTRLTCKRCKKPWWWKIIVGFPEPDLCVPCEKQK